MCMMAAAVNKDFGVLASDSAQYVTDSGEISFESWKLVKAGRYLVSFIGTPLYFSNLDRGKLALPFDQLSLYLREYLTNEKPKVAETMAETIQDPDENKPHFCLYLLGLHGKRPTLAQFNSFSDFKPKYLWSDNGLKFSTILYGDDSKPEKTELFKESTKYMEELSAKWKEAQVPVSPGLVGEILTRGIYKKADLEMEIGLKKKYAGGMVNAAVLKSDGLVYSLVGTEVVNGGI